jgi:type I restriction enzyme, S subunit
MNNYKLYKDSGVEWIGEVPEHWGIYHLKNIVSTKITDGPHETPVFTDDGVPFISAEAIQNGNVNFDSKRGFISEETDKIYSLKCKPRKNDIFIVKSGSTTGKIGYVSTEINFNIWSPLALVRANKINNSHYLFYFLSSSFFQKQVQMYWSFGTQPNIGMKVLENLQVVSPPLAEQKLIAHYLDTKTAQIDRKIDLLTQKATQYGNLKQSLINETVTRGLDKSVLMKDSAIEWIGEMPKHWTLSRIKEEGTVRGRVGWKALKADEYVDEGYIFLSTPNIKEKEIDFKNVNYITHERYIESPEIMIQSGDILLTKDGSTLGTTNIVNSLPRKATVNSSIAVIRFSKKIFKKYIYYQVLSDFIQNKISLKKSGMGVPHLFQKDINNFSILVPPFSEQTAIANYLDIKTAQIDQIIQTLNTQIEKLKELRKTLINDVVTGKIRVIENQ